MAANKNFVERDVAEGDEPLFETVKFNDLRNEDGGRGDWFTHILLGYIPEPEFSEMLATDGWNPEAMQVNITVNGVRIIHAQFEAIISEFSGRMLNERLQRGNWHNFEKAVETKAKHLLKASLGDFLDNAHTLSRNIEHLADSSDSLVQSAWNIPWRDLVTDEMKTEGQRVIDEFGSYEPTVTNRRVLSEKVYNAMANARPAPHDKSVKITLPPVHKRAPSDLMGSLVMDKRELRGRMEMLNEVKAILAQYNINVEDL